jgi:glutamine synthetase
LFAEGTMFDGSSIAGWKAINESDMTLMPDPETAVIDPFFAQPTLAIICDILEPSTGEPYNRDPRTTAKKALAYLQSMGIGDTAYFGPEAEFFIFDDVRFSTDAYNTGFKLDSSSCRRNGGRISRAATSAHGPRTKGGYFPVPPDRFRAGSPVRHAHVHGADGRASEKASPRGGLRPARARHQVPDAGELRRQPADLQILHPPDRAGLRQDGDLHAQAGLRRQRLGHARHQSIWKAGKPVFAGNRYADLSEECLFYYRRHPQARQGAERADQSVDQLLQAAGPGYEAPVLLAYSARNRSASCRIPYTSSPKAKRLEVRFPDPTANPYLAFTAMLMAGPRRHPQPHPSGRPDGQGPYDLPPAELKEIPTSAGSLREALRASMPTATSSRPAASSTTIRSTPISS